MKRAKRPAGLRIATRGTVRTVRPLRDAEKALAATARLSLASLDTDMLRRLWTTQRTTRANWRCATSTQSRWCAVRRRR
jgi:hypothetical protein